MRLKLLFVLLVTTALFTLPQNAYSQASGTDDYIDPHQTIIDSLLARINPDTPDNTKAKYYSKIASVAVISDTIQKYASLSLDLCKSTDNLLLAQNYQLLGQAYDRNEEFRKALPYYQKSIQISLKINSSKLTAKTYQMLSLVYAGLNKIDSATFYMNQALDISKKNNDTTLLVDCYRYLGNIYCDIKMFKEAESYFKKAFEIDSLSGNSHEYATDLYELAQLIDGQENCSTQDLITATEYLAKAACVFEAGNSYTKFYVYRIFSSVYIKLAQKTGEKKYADSCFYYHQKADTYFIKNAPTSEFRSFYYVYVDYMIFYKRYSEAEFFMISLGNSFNEETSPLEYEEYHRKFKEVYLLLGNYEKAYEHSEKQREYAWKNLNDNTISAIADIKAEQAVVEDKMKREKAEIMHAAEKKQMKIVIFSLIGGLVLVLLLVFYIFRVLKIRKRANAELSEKNSLLAAQNEEIEAQRDTIKAQSDEIQASINYARRIQRSMLPPNETITSVFPDHFLLYKPRDIVSGDYYWVGQFGDNKVCIVADCTGHGVPGGFLSVMGMSNLNFIVGQDVGPDAILNRLRETIITNLRQRDDASSALQDESSSATAFYRSCDGMDAVVYIVNERQMTLTFAGANNPLVLIRGNEIQVLKGDRMPVGIYARLNPFQSTTVDIQKGDCIYTFSDGFQDQFENGGVNNKFTARRLRQLLLEIHQQPMAEQKEILNRTFEEWRGPAENQTDDVVVMGVRI